MNLPFGGAKGGVASTRVALVVASWSASRAATPSEIIEVIGPRPRHPGPRPRHGRADDGVDHGHLLACRGYTVPGVVTGKPIELGGCSAGARRPAAACSCAWSRRAATSGSPLENARVVVQGYGNVGAARRGCASSARAMIAVSRREGRHPRHERARHRQGRRTCASTGCLAGFPGARAITNAEMLELPCEVLVPAAVRNGQITERNAGELACRDARRGRQRSDDASRPTRSSTNAASSSCPTSCPTRAA